MITVRNLMRKLHLVTVPRIAQDLYAQVARAALGGFYSVVADDISRKVKSGKILDIGTGPGYLPINIARRTKSVQTIGIDIDPRAIAHAQANAAEFGVPINRAHFEVGDAHKLGFGNNEFDFVVSTGVIRYAKNPVKMLDEIHRVLKKGGEAWLYDFCRDSTDQEIDEQIKDIDDRLKAGGMGKLQRSWVTLIMKRQIGVESYSLSELYNIVARSRFGTCHILRDGVWAKIVLRKTGVEKEEKEKEKTEKKKQKRK
jgi:ubiquinone/menaquinone biosynthesis C-methylase UbiE